LPQQFFKLTLRKRVIYVCPVPIFNLGKLGQKFFFYLFIFVLFWFFPSKNSGYPDAHYSLNIGHLLGSAGKLEFPSFCLDADIKLE